MNDPNSPFTQRWRDRQHSWRHKSEGGFDSSRYEVALIADDTTAKAFVVQHHYSRSYPSATIRAGLYDGSQLVGVAVLGVPASRKVLTRAFPGLEPYDESLELSRFVLLDTVPANAETWFLAQTFRLAAHEGLRGVVSFADPIARITEAGEVLSPGHVGTIYQASNGLFTADRGTARTLKMGPDGRVLNDRALQKIRQREQGHEYAMRQLVEWGATPMLPDETPAAWLAHALSEARIRRVRHPGNFRYLFRVGRTRAERSRVAFGMAGAAYPKVSAA